jgi:hypothetical protein
MVTTQMGLKLPGENDFYNVADFNDNFRTIENAIVALTERFESARAAIPHFATGLVTASNANGAEVELGFRPRCVFVFARRMTGSVGSGTTTTWVPWGRFLAMAIDASAGNQVNPGLSGDVITLEIRANGFWVNQMLGAISADIPATQAARVTTQEVAATRALRYVAFG